MQLSMLGPHPICLEDCVYFLLHNTHPYHHQQFHLHLHIHTSYRYRSKQIDTNHAPYAVQITQLQPNAKKKRSAETSTRNQSSVNYAKPMLLPLGVYHHKYVNGYKVRFPRLFIDQSSPVMNPPSNRRTSKEDHERQSKI